MTIWDRSEVKMTGKIELRTENEGGYVFTLLKERLQSSIDGVSCMS